LKEISRLCVSGCQQGDDSGTPQAGLGDHDRSLIGSRPAPGSSLLLSGPAVLSGLATPALIRRDKAKPTTAAPASMITGCVRPNSAADINRSPIFFSRRSSARRSIFLAAPRT